MKQTEHRREPVVHAQETTEHRSRAAAVACQRVSVSSWSPDIRSSASEFDRCYGSEVRRYGLAAWRLGPGGGQRGGPEGGRVCTWRHPLMVAMLLANRL